jgi:uracil-DNA glycosylase
MVPAQRQQYLEALGIDQWASRTAPAGASVPVAEPALPAPAEKSPPPAAMGAPPLPVPQLAPAAGDAPLWQALREEVLRCTRCPLHLTRTQGVLGVGPQRADWLVVGEAPGAEEDRRGEPFVGAAGQLLDAMLRAIGLDRTSNVYIANVLKSRPPGNRDPKPEEVSACMPYLQRQVELLRPKIMLAVGRIAAQSLLGTEAPLGRLRSQVHHFGTIPLVVTYHPAYLLRSPGEKRKAWEDLKFARGIYQQLGQEAGNGLRA